MGRRLARLRWAIRSSYFVTNITVMRKSRSTPPRLFGLMRRIESSSQRKSADVDSQTVIVRAPEKIYSWRGHGHGNRARLLFTDRTSRTESESLSHADQGLRPGESCGTG